MSRDLAMAVLLLALPISAAAQAQFSASASPNPVTLQTGGAVVGVTVTTSPLVDFREPITYSFSGFPAGITTGGARTVNPPFNPVTFPFSAAGSVAAGTYTGTLTGTTSASTVSVPMTVIVQRPDFVLSASPGSLILEPGATGTVNVAVMGTGGFTGTVDVVANGTASLSVQPGSFTVAAGASRPVVVTAAASATPASLSLSFTGTATAVDGPRTAVVSVTIRLPPPTIERITPPVMAAGTGENVLRLTGRHFQPNAVVTSGVPGVQVVRARVLSPTAAEVVVAVRPDAPPGPYRLDFRNPDGAMAAGGAVVTVRPAGSLAGPLAVTGVRMIAPRPWQIVAEDEPIHAHALLATSGVGTVAGMWVLDGIPFERFTRVVSSGHPVEVRSTRPIPSSFTGEHRLELVLESPRSLPPQQVSFLQAPERRSALRVLAPGPAGSMDPESPVFRWSLVPGASGYEVEVEYRAWGLEESSPWTAVRRRVTDSEWRPERALVTRLRGMETRFRVRAAFPGEVFGESTPWRPFTLHSGGPDPDEPGGPPPPGESGDATESGPWGEPEHPPGASARAQPVGSPDPSRHLDFSLGNTTTASDTDLPGPSASTRLHVSTRTDLRGHSLDQQVVGDISASHDLGDPWHGRADSRSWVARLAVPNGEVRPAVTVGFAPPSFLDQNELLNVFSAGGGVQGTIGSSVGRVSYFRSARLASSHGPGGPDPEVGAAAYELFTPDGRFLFRATTLHVSEQPVEGFSPGGDGMGFGFLAGADMGPRLQLLGEAAFGDYRPGEDSYDEARDGRAFRLAARGGAGTVGYTLAVGRTDAGFVNPANPGFTPGGLSGRTRADITLTNTFFGRASVSGSYNHVRGGIGDGLGDPKTTENGANLRLSLPVSSRVSVSVGGNMVAQRGDGIEELELPETHRGHKGVDLSVTQTLGRFGLSQTVSWQGLSDRAQPWADQRVLDVNLGAHGTLHRFVDVSVGVSETRIDGEPDLGSTRHRLASVQPTLTIGGTGLRLTPRLALTRASNAALDSDFRTTQYQLSAQWVAPWAAIPLTLDVASDWNRSWSAFDDERPGFNRLTMLTLGVSWRADRAW